TAIAFAVVGSFEAAIEGWHDYEQRGPGDSDGVILAATAGAVGLRIGPGASIAPAGDADDTQPDGAATPTALVPPGQTPEVGHLRIIVGLVWRTVVMWMVLLALLTLARLLG
ncbi:MAG: cobalamin biosynthesis protein CbiB, partial [Burkholderiaceae bacterium]